jgi:hypothetical protein
MPLEFVKVIDYEDTSSRIRFYHYELLGPAQCFNLNGRARSSKPNQESKSPSGHAVPVPSRYLEAHESFFSFMVPYFLTRSD